jgi:uracil-DNA glycosylase family 4
MNFDKLKKEILNCKECQNVFGFEPHPVIFGNQCSKIVQISQAPSANVHITRKPFTDQSGKKLKYEWYQINDDDFYNEDNFYITALAHCFPGKAKNGADKSPPKICYEKWIIKELSLISNDLYVIIGAKAANVFFPDEKYEKLIFKDNVLNGKKAIVLPHPSPLNIKWFKDNPKFYNERLSEIRKTIKEIIK